MKKCQSTDGKNKTKAEQNRTTMTLVKEKMN